MKIRHSLGLIMLALAAAVPASANKLALNELGTISGTLDGKAREWVTVSGQFQGEVMNSATWQRISFSMPDFGQIMESMAGMLTPEQRAQLGMLQNMDMENNPMAGMLGQMMGQEATPSESIQITIGGHDPDSPNVMTSQAIVLTVDLDSLDDATGRALPAELTYVVEASASGMPQVLYVSDDESNTSVTFDQLDIEPGGGHARGRFTGFMCRVDMRNLMAGPDLTDCMDAEGQFDTKLGEDEAFSS